MQLPDSVVGVLHREDGSSRQTELDYRVAWGLTTLKKIGAADNPSRGRWTATEFGQTIDSPERLQALIDRYRRRLQFNPDPVARRRLPPTPSPGPTGAGAGTSTRASPLAPSSQSRKTQWSWVLKSMQMLAGAGVTEPSLDSIEHAARSLGWEGNRQSLRSSVWTAKGGGLLHSPQHGRYSLPDPGEAAVESEPVGATKPAQELGAVKPAQEPPSHDRDALAACVERLADVVGELKQAVEGLARD